MLTMMCAPNVTRQSSPMKRQLIVVLTLGLLAAACSATDPGSSTTPLVTTTTTAPTTTAAIPTTSTSSPTACMEPISWAFESLTHTHEIVDVGHDGSGGLWIATGGGAIHLDSSNGQFTRYHSEDGLASDGLTAVEVAGDGSVWFGTYDAGVSRWVNGEWSTFSVPELPHREVTSLAIAEDEVWVATPAGLGHFDDGVWTKLTEIGGRPLGYVMSVAVGSDGRVWLFEGGGEGEHYRPGYIAVQRGGTWQIVTEIEPFSGRLSRVDGAGSVWFADPNAGSPLIEAVERSQIHRFTADDGLPDSPLSAVAVDDDGSLWVGTGSGIARRTHDDWETVSELGPIARLDPVAMDWDGGALWVAVADGRIFRHTPAGTGEWSLPSDLPAHPTDVAVTESGVIWVSTDPGGVVRIDAQGSTQFTRADGVADNRLWVVAATDDAVWVGTAGLYGVSAFDGSRWTSHDQIGDSDVKDISIAPGGDAWIAAGQVLYQVTGSEWTARLDTSIQGNTWYVESVDASFDGQVWVSGPDGPGLYEAGEWRQFSAADGRGYVNVVAASPDGTVWAGGKGLTQFTDGAWKVVQNPGFGNDGIIELAVSPDTSIWVGTRNGIFIHDDRSWTHLTAADGLTSNQVLAIEFDTQGTAWIVTSAGLSKASPQCDTMDIVPDTATTSTSILRADGIGPIDFRTPMNFALSLLIELLGEPSDDTELTCDVPGCHVAVHALDYYRAVRWDEYGLTVFFSDQGPQREQRVPPEFNGWRVEDPSRTGGQLTTSEGVGVESTVSALSDAYGESFTWDSGPPDECLGAWQFVVRTQIPSAWPDLGPQWYRLRGWFDTDPAQPAARVFRLEGGLHATSAC